MAATEAWIDLLFVYVFYVGIFGVMLMCQGLAVSMARLKAKKAGNDARQERLVNNANSPNPVEVLIRLRSRAHGNNQEWVPTYCIMLGALLAVQVDPGLFHTLAWSFLVVRITLHFLMVYNVKTMVKSVFAGLNYVLFFVTALVCWVHAIRRFLFREDIPWSE